jgi:hypothetical protein
MFYRSYLRTCLLWCCIYTVYNPWYVTPDQIVPEYCFESGFFNQKREECATNALNACFISRIQLADYLEQRQVQCDESLPVVKAIYNHTLVQARHTIRTIDKKNNKLVLVFLCVCVVFLSRHTNQS